MIAPLQLADAIVDLLILLLHFLTILMQLRHFLLQLPCHLLLLCESLQVLLLLAAYYHADFDNILVYLSIAFVLFQLLQEEQDALLV